MARRRLDFHWNLRRLMAAHEMWKTTSLTPLLQERGVDLSPTQICRLVTEKPERLSMQVLVALCDIFDCTPSDLITPYVQEGRRPKAVADDSAEVVELTHEVRPERARIVHDPQ